MARKKRSLLPPVTDHDITTQAERLRRTAYGWAWKCAYCGQFASSETVKGKFVCRRHGGVTARQRDPEARLQAREAGAPLSRPPGRPIQHGHASRHGRLRIDEIVADYRARQVDADCTDDNMLYLRAYQQERMEVQPSLRRAAEAANQLKERLQNEGVEAADLRDLQNLVKETRLLIQRVSRAQETIENGHARIIRMAKIRAETKVKNSAARQLEVFTVMVKRLVVVLEEQLSPADYQALQARIARDLEEVSEGMVDGRAPLR